MLRSHAADYWHAPASAVKPCGCEARLAPKPQRKREQHPDDAAPSRKWGQRKLIKAGIASGSPDFEQQALHQPFTVRERPERLVKCLLLKVRGPRCYSCFYQFPLTPFSAWCCVVWVLLPLALWLWG